MRVYTYLRASTKEQNALRAKETLSEFAKSLNVKISAWFIENESGAKLQRPELFRLLDTAEPGDAILIEQIDNRIKVISLDLSTSHGKFDKYSIRNALISRTESLNHCNDLRAIIARTRFAISLTSFR